MKQMPVKLSVCFAQLRRSPRQYSGKLIVIVSNLVLVIRCLPFTAFFQKVSLLLVLPSSFANLHARKRFDLRDNVSYDILQT